MVGLQTAVSKVPDLQEESEIMVNIGTGQRRLSECCHSKKDEALLHTMVNTTGWRICDRNTNIKQILKKSGNDDKCRCAFHALLPQNSWGPQETVVACRQTPVLFYAHYSPKTTQEQ